MIVIAGPPGGGKSTHFKARSSGTEAFNSDDRAAQLNGGSYHQIPPDVRAAAGQQLQEFIESHIDRRTSFAFENALRTDACFDQFRRAKLAGFKVLVDYLAAGPVEEHIQRVAARAALGGHAASERKLRMIYENSMKNLVTAFEENLLGHINVLQIFDNSVILGLPRLVLAMVAGKPVHLEEPMPAWLESALKGSQFEVAALRRSFNQRA